MSIKPNQYIVSRINDKTLEAECVYDPKNVGCFIIRPSKIDDGDEDDKEDLKEQCDNVINNYPTVKLKNDSTVKFDSYSCGRNSTNFKMWNTTGYDNPKDMCYKMLQERSILNEMKNLS